MPHWWVIVSASGANDLTAGWFELTIDLRTVAGCNLAGLVAVIFSAFEPGEFQF